MTRGGRGVEKLEFWGNVIYGWSLSKNPKDCERFEKIPKDAEKIQSISKDSER